MKPLLLFLFCVVYLFTPAQTPIISPLVFTHITEENGLSDNHTTAVFKDKEDMVWVGTKNGLNLLDGSTIRIFKYAAGDSNSLCNNFITGITQDKNGDIWISTANGVCSYNKKQKRFISLKTDKKTGEIGGVCNIVADKNNSLWFGTARGLLQYNITTKQLDLYSNNSTLFGTDPAYSNKINHLVVAADNTAWLATGDGLWNFSPTSKTFKKIIHKENDHYYNPLCLYVYEDSDKKIWAGFWSTGLKRYDPVTGQLTDHGKGLDYSVSSIAELKNADGKKVLWLNGSLMAFDEEASRYFHFEPPVNEKEAFNTWPLYTEEQGRIWLASDDGLYIYNPEQQVFSHQLFDGNMTSQGVPVLDHKNALLIGGQGGSFLTLRTESGKLIKDYSYWCRNTAAMLSILRAGEDDFWMTSTEGISHVNLATNDIKWFQHKDGDSNSLPRNFITSLCIDSKQNLWVFPWREGIWQMDKQTGDCKKLLDGFLTISGKTKKLLISDAKEDPAGNIWMADLDEGIILYDAGTKKFSKPFEKQIGDKVPASRIFISNGKMYSAIPDAILVWGWEDRVPQLISLPPELNKYIVDIYPDRSGNWWLTTHSGLILYNEASHSFHRFTTADGLYQDDIPGNLFCTENNTMMIVSPGYFTSFKPERLNNTLSSQKNVIVTAFIAGNRDIQLNDSSAVSLSHNENNIIIRWALPVYNNPLRNRYYYLLEGIDSTWRFAGNKGEVQYANLSRGHYTILLKAATANETSSANIITLHFTIRPPYWKTWWFKLMTVLAISSLFFVTVRYISQRNLKEKLLRLEKEQAIVEERNRISRDMHDDLGSGLTKIAIMSEVVKKQMHDPEKAKQQLESISESSRELVDNLQDIIWVLNPRNDTLDSLAAYIREYGLKFFESLGVDIQFIYPEKFLVLKLSEETRRNIFLVIKETFNNIAKHAGCNKVKVTIEQAPSSVLLIIEDDGKGFDKVNLRPFSNGLANMKARIGQVNGHYKIETGKNQGTRTIIEIPV